MKRLHHLARRLLPLSVLLLLLTAAPGARADTALALWKTFDGRVNFTGTQVTLRTASNSSGSRNGSSCTVTAPSTSRSANLNLPWDAVVVSAQLYWAGSGVRDNTVTFQGREITAGRKFTSSASKGFNYFGGAADVTRLVKAGGTYKFSGLSVSSGSPWCASQGVLGGFSLLVVYRLSSEPLRVLNIYEGFQRLQNASLVVNASNFRWSRTDAPTEEKARIGHITWEGDPTLGQNGESLSFEGKALTDANNPAGNQFNSFSNVNNGAASHGIDFDVYDTTVTISPFDDAVVTTGYSTGQDLVLLNAEILLVPTMQVADLAIKIARSGALKVNTDVDYTVTVTNNGPVTEAGTITVTNTLPPGMVYVSGTATGWSCSASSTSATCTYTRGLAPGASAPVLTVRARVTTLGEKTNTVVVKGTTSDDNLDNNTASNTGTATNSDGSTGTGSGTRSSFIFTDSKCVDDIAIGAAGQTCKRYTASTVGGKPASIWLTATNSEGVPSARSRSRETSATLRFMLECENPATGTVSARYAGVAIPVCAAPGKAATWSDPVTIDFSDETVSVLRSFVYHDIGKIRLTLKDSDDGTDRTEGFVSAPLRVDFKRITNGTHDNPGTITSGGAGFAQAGAALPIEIGAVLGDGVSPPNFAPNFGKEMRTPLIVLDQSVAVDSLASQGALGENTEKRKWLGGILTTEASWSEVGAVNFTVRTDDPDMATGGANHYLGVPIGGGTAAVGRFYPAYFATDVIGPFNCPRNLPAAINCPREIDGDINGAVYSQQPFAVTVMAYNARDERLENFPGAWFKPVTLSAAAANGGDVLPINLTPPAGKTNNIATTASELPFRPSYRLATGYDDDTPRVQVTDPSVVAVRAEALETTLAGDVTITSRRSDAVSNEGSILVLNGRMKLPNALGSDLLRTPLRLREEYWAGAGAGWLFNARFTGERAVTNANLGFRECKFDFADADGCIMSLLGVADTRLAFNGGAGTLWLRAPGKKIGGASRRGGFSVRYTDAPWLPGTTGRVSFGSPRSPVIYVREMYF